MCDFACNDRSAEDAPQCIDSRGAAQRVFTAFGGPQGHGDSFEDVGLTRRAPLPVGRGSVSIRAANVRERFRNVRRSAQRVFIGLGGPRGHGDSLMAAALNGRQAAEPRASASGFTLLLLLILLAVVGRAEVIDRIAITVGRSAITESDILREIRLAALFNQTEPDYSPLAKRQAAGRLVVRALVKTEMESGQYAFPDPSEAAPVLAAKKKEWFPDEAAFLAALSKYRIGEGDVRNELLDHLALDSFVEERFGPVVQVTDDEIREYYTSRILPLWEDEKKGAAPPFDEVLREKIDELLRAQRADALLNNWLKEARDRTRIEFKDEALR
jgi:hypothetical protein